MHSVEPAPWVSPRLRIVVLDVFLDLWCDSCAALSATAITFLVEENDTGPREMQRLTYCRTCEGE